jgi:HEAT repeat protein
MGITGRMARRGRTLTAVVLLFSPALRDVPAPLFAQVPFDQAVRDLASPDAGTRLHALQLLTDAGYAEAAVPLAKLIADPRDEIQLGAIAAELNIFLAEPVVTRTRVGVVVEKRNPIAAEAAFSAGPAAVGVRPVPLDVLTALRAAARDDNARVALEALYGFGVLAVEPAGSRRRELLRAAGPQIAALVGATDPAIRHAAVRVMGRLFTPRPHDDPIETTVGDAVITALNDSDRAVKVAAMESLGAMRYDRAVRALTDLFQYYGKGESAEAALDALARIANGASVPLFTAQLAGKNASLRGIAIEGLARVGDTTRIADVQTAAAADRGDRVALAAAFASVLLANGNIDRIVDALTRSKLRDQARGYLVEVAPGRAESFRRHTMDPDARIRLDVVGVLDLAGDPAALSVVEPLTQDKDPQVARAAERAVARLRAALTRPPN